MTSNENISALLALCAGKSPVTGEFLSQRPVMRCFDVSFELCLNKRLSKQSKLRWFGTPSRSLWRHCYVSLFTHIPQGCRCYRESYDFPSTSEATLKGMGNIDQYQTATKQSTNHVHNSWNVLCWHVYLRHFCEVIMGMIASQITSLTIVNSTVYSDTDQRKQQSSASLAFVRGEFTGPWWIPPAQMQWRGKCFHLMTSSLGGWGGGAGMRHILLTWNNTQHWFFLEHISSCVMWIKWHACTA